LPATWAAEHDNLRNVGFESASTGGASAAKTLKQILPACKLDFADYDNDMGPNLLSMQRGEVCAVSATGKGKS